MRSLLLVLLTVALLGGGLALYTFMQPANPAGPQRPLTATTRPQIKPGETIRLIGEGENVWLKRYDPETGELESQFKGAKYTPQKDGTVNVEKPEAEFFSGDGKQRVRIEGISGNVLMELPPEEDSKQSFQPSGQGQMPTRGKLHDVIVSVFEPVDAAEPILTAKMNNAAFDTVTFRIATEPFVEASGKTIEADQVPVIVRGRDYDFDGKGLVIRWNQRDRKLQLLEIAHGESMVLKNPALLGGEGGGILPGTTATPATQPGARADRPSEMLATTDAGFALAAVTPRRRSATVSATAPAEAPVVYRATFERDVRIFEGDKPVATVARMHIDMLQEEKKKPSTQATTRTTAPAKPKKSTTTQAAGPTTMKGPVTVKWSGKLSIVPLAGPPDPAMVPGKAIIHMLGSPAVVSYDGRDAQCGELVFNAATNSGSMLTSADVPQVTMTAPDGMKLITPRLDYTQLPGNRSLATLVGKSSADLPMENDAGKVEMVKASWSKDAKLTLGQVNGEQMLEKADLAGDVAVDHPEMKLTSQALNMGFDPKPAEKKVAASTKASTKPSQMSATLRELVATGNVDCQFIDPKNPQTMKANRLEVRPRTPGTSDSGWNIVADGNVATRDKSGEMKAGQMRAELVPSTQPGEKLQLASLLASDNVNLANGKTTAVADRLQGDTFENSPRYTLIGKPDAKVTNGQTTLIGREIVFRPERGIAQIVGPGSTEGVNPDNLKQKLNITWTGGANVDGNANLIDIDRGVDVRSVEGNTISGATANHLQAKLTTRPSTNPAVATTKKSSPDSASDFFADKEISAGTLTGNVEVKTEEYAADGSLIQATNLFSEKVMYDQAARRLEVPMAGRMLFEDRRPPDPKGQQKTQGPTISSGRGLTAFIWQESLIYEEQQLAATMAGNVKVIHKPENNKDQPFNLSADHLKAGFKRKKPTAPTPGAPAQPAPVAAAPADAMKDLDPTSVVATGNVQVTSTRLNFDAKTMTFDMENETLIATGDERQPVNMFDNQKGSTTRMLKLFWNTKTDEIRIEGLIGKVSQ